jgi:hypothetical protein
MGSLCLAPILTPHGRLTLEQVNDAPPLDPKLAQRLQDAFGRGSGHALLQLGASEVGTGLPPVFSYWREFGARYVTALCTRFDAEARHLKVHVPAPPNEELEPLIRASRRRSGWPPLEPCIFDETPIRTVPGLPADQPTAATSRVVTVEITHGQRT